MKIESNTDVDHFKGNHKGRVYLTTHRMIFTSVSDKDMLQSFSMPFMCIKELELEQPVFGANFIKGKVLSQPGGNWNGQAKFKLHFMHGGAIEYGQALLKAGRMACSRGMAQQPPPYVPPPASFQQAPPPMYMPPPQGYGFQLPTDTFPTAPLANGPGVYMYDAPPPYPGIYETTPQQAPSAAAAKAQEAAQSQPNNAYYNPSNPHNVYMPQQPGAGMQQPPPYNPTSNGYPQQAPPYPQQAPAYGYPQQSPAYPQQAPAYPQQSPAYPQQSPAYPQQAPAYPQQSPAYPQQSPAYPQQSPAYPQQAPAYPQQAPASGYPQQAPAYGYPQQGATGQGPPYSGQTLPSYEEVSRDKKND
ncbi:PREDICTED: WW domain-binding protein 2-like isoform X2 [Priapulus caudatus]|nr:PREDICTED: WW domain-binding protein 2-like isoform X2 [Priapulus caudatus]